MDQNNLCSYVHYVPLTNEKLNTLNTRLAFPSSSNTGPTWNDYLFTIKGNNVIFNNIKFMYDSPLEDNGRSIQSANYAYSSVLVYFGSNITFNNCTFAHLGGYALEIINSDYSCGKAVNCSKGLIALRLFQ